MRLLKSSIFFSFLVLILFVLSGCSLFHKNYDAKYMIEDYNIFNKSENEYYVYFYKDNCKYCIDSYESINKYLKSTAHTKLYVCDLTNSNLKRVYEGENGQGIEGYFFVNGVTNYSELYE